MDEPVVRLTEEQVSAILRRAAELQETQGRSPGEPGVTSADVVKIGEELGLDRQCLRTAIQEIADGLSSGKPRGFWGAPAKLEEARVYPVEFTEDDWHEVVEELRSKFKRIGVVSEVAGAREWDGKEDGLSPIHVSVRSKDGSTRASIKSDMSSSAIVLGVTTVFPVLLGAVGFARTLPIELWGQAMVVAGIVGLGGAILRKGHGYFCAKRERAVEEVFARISERVEERWRDQTLSPLERSQETSELERLRQES